MFRDQPGFVADVLRDVLGITIPDFTQAQLTSSDLTDVAPTEYRADAVITLANDTGLVLAVVIEAQLRIDPRKRQTWPVYVATLHARLGCPIILLIVCPKPAVATWCAEPIVIGTPGLTLTPVVLGPNDVPVVTDPDQAKRQPELAVLSAMTHGARHREPVFHALLAALDVLGPDHAALYADLVLAALPTAARKLLEVCMTTTTHRYQSDFARRYFDQGEAKGQAKGEARSVLAVLSARGIDVPADVRERITSCTDLDQLETWVRRAVTIRTAQDLFTDERP
jgi:hypothetical protein